MPTLVVNQGAIGDLLISLPSFRLLRSRLGDFTLAGIPNNCLFLKAIGEITSVIPTTAAGFNELYSGSIPPLLRYFDDVWWFTRRRGLIPTIYQMPDSKIKAKPIFTVDEGPSRTNCTLFQFQQVSKLLNAEDVKVEDYLRPLKLAGMQQGGDRFPLVIHPGSGSKKKNIPLDLFFTLSNSLLEGIPWLQIIYILGPAEEEMVPAVEEFALNSNGRVKILKDQDLITVAHLLGQTGIFLGNDSGLAHLAAWSGATCYILYGPTDPGLWAPKTGTVKTFKSEASCSPCNDSYRSCNNLVCLEKLDMYKILRDLFTDLQLLGHTSGGKP